MLLHSTLNLDCQGANLVRKVFVDCCRRVQALKDLALHESPSSVWKSEPEIGIVCLIIDVAGVNRSSWYISAQNDGGQRFNFNVKIRLGIQDCDHVACVPVGFCSLCIIKLCFSLLAHCVVGLKNAVKNLSNLGEFVLVDGKHEFTLRSVFINNANLYAFSLCQTCSRR